MKEASKEYINKYKMAHCIAVAEYMAKRADDYYLDKNQMYVLGLLHDIGYLRGRENHGKTGASILKSMGLEDKYVEAVLNHGRDPYQIAETFYVITPELRLLYEADMSIDKEGNNVGFKGRLEDIKKRYGEDSIAYETASNTVKWLKEQYQKEQQVKEEEQYDER